MFTAEVPTWLRIMTSRVATPISGIDTITALRSENMGLFMQSLTLVGMTAVLHSGGYGSSVRRHAGGSSYGFVTTPQDEDWSSRTAANYGASSSSSSFPFGFSL